MQERETLSLEVSGMDALSRNAHAFGDPCGAGARLPPRTCARSSIS
jgi:hypothetical protein